MRLAAHGGLGFRVRWGQAFGRSADAGAPPPPVDPAERFARMFLAEHGAVTHADLVAAVRGWLNRRERALGGGAIDLFAWGEELWQAQAERTVARLQGDPRLLPRVQT